MAVWRARVGTRGFAIPLPDVRARLGQAECIAVSVATCANTGTSGSYLMPNRFAVPLVPGPDTTDCIELV